MDAQVGPARPYDVAAVRAHFPALDRGTVHFDGPAGTQVPAACVAAVAEHLERWNSNSTQGAPFRDTPAAARTNALIERIHAAAADFVGASDPAECVVGANMTTLAFAMTRRIGRALRPGDELLLSPLDHDANIAPWLLLAEERSLRVRWLPPSLPRCTLDASSVVETIGPRTRVVSLGLASNAVGTLVDGQAVAAIAAAAHASGAIVWVDAVHAAAHVPLDVRALDVDVLLWSAYKVYGPHLGLCWVRRGILDVLPAQNVRWPAPAGPHRLETGTPAYELFAGLEATVGYLRWLGRTFGEPAGGLPPERGEIVAALEAIRRYEADLASRLLARLAAIPGCRVLGLADPADVGRRCPTVALTIEGRTPAAVADECCRRGFAVWSGEFASFELMRRLGLQGSGVVRVGIAHYNTAAEVDALAETLADVAAAAPDG
ncbi:MAG: cysteine desulfurase-like protein [Chloroflexi bacterium]|nr:cysteine desulfurase-like protein [Chloroflexota bacterium]